MFAKRLLLSAVLAMTFVPAAQAGYVTGAQLSNLCRANMGGHGHVIEAAECMGYIVGVADTFDCKETLHGFTWNSAAKVSQPQLVVVVLKWLDAHPASQSDDSDSLVGAALAEAYPCPK